MRRFWADENGGTTVEFVLWFPILVGVIGVVFDGSMAMMSQTELWTVASNTSRLVALNQLTETEAEDFARSIAPEGTIYNVDVTVSGTTVVTTVSRPFENLPGIGVLAPIDADLSVQAIYRIEPSV